jgi:multiple antibiotic resistance protein
MYYCGRLYREYGLSSIRNLQKRGSIAETDAQCENDIALTPLAIHLAGPGSISLLIAFYQEHNTTMEIIISIAILAIAVAIFIILKVLIISLKYWEHLGS